MVTGLGIASAVGVGEEAVWESLVSGRGGIDHLKSLDTSDLKVGIGGEVDQEVVASGLKPVEAAGDRPRSRPGDDRCCRRPGAGGADRR